MPRQKPKMGSPKCQGKIAIHESRVTVFDWIQLWGYWTGCKFITLQLREVLTGKPRLHQESALVPTLLYLSWMLSLAATMSLAAAAGHAREWELHSKCCLFICLEIWKSKEAKAGKTQVCGLQTTVTSPKPSSLQGKARHVLRHNQVRTKSVTSCCPSQNCIYWISEWKGWRRIQH